MRNLQKRCRPFANMISKAKDEGYYPYFRPISRNMGPEVEVDGRCLVMFGSNDYLGLTHDPRVVEAAADAIRRWGTGPGGSRFLNGNMVLHDELEARLARFVGKRHAVVHTTGFLTNLGAIACLASASDVILCDRENHASIFEGSLASPARVTTYPHNDIESAAEKLAQAREKDPDSRVFVITDGVFSMSGDVANLGGIARLKDGDQDLIIYLDDAHGIGVMGKGGHGTAAHFGLGNHCDFIMGTFSKALASVGGFIASDDKDILTYLRHHSKTLIFSAALPAGNVASVLAALDIVESDESPIDRMKANTKRLRDGFRRIGLYVRDLETPIVPVYIGSEFKAYDFARDLFEMGVFALPAVFPAVPRGQAVIRTACMAHHEPRHIDRMLEVLEELGGKYGIRMSDLNGDEPYLDETVPAASRSA